MSDRLRAVVYDRYGAADVLRLSDVARPAPKNDEVLIEIHATTVNRTEWGFRRCKPFMVRFVGGLTRPRRPILGSEFAELELTAWTAWIGPQKTGNVVLTISGDSEA